MAKQVVLNRSDFSGGDSSGMGYFEYVLSSLNIPKEKWDSIETVTLDCPTFQIN